MLRTQSADGNAVLSPASIGHAVLMARAAADERSEAWRHEAIAASVAADPVDAAPRRLADALGGPGLAVISEIKRRSPSKGDLQPDLDPRVVMPAFGWWYPEEPSTQYDWRKSNINILTDTDLEELATGATQLRGIPCRLYKYEEI